MKTFITCLIAGLLLMLAVPTVSFSDNPIADSYVLPCAVFLFGFAVMLFKKPSAKDDFTHVAGINLEVWVRYIIERFWKDNKFLQYAYNDDPYVVAGKIVHIPQPGNKPVVQKNRAVYPGVAVRRTDTDITYTLDEFSTDPSHVPDADKVALSYSKMDSVFGDHATVLNETAADEMLRLWASDNPNNFVRTTGGPGAGTVAGVAGQTGTRKGFHHKDLAKVMTLFNTTNVPKQDRYVLIDDNMFEFFYDSLSDNQAKNFSEYVDAQNGIVGKLHGFNIMTRSSVLAVTSADAVKALGAALGATDNLVSLAWHKNSVARAMGEVKMFQDLNNPLYYGDIHSALIRLGGRKRRANGEGIAMITQAAGA